MLGGGDEFPRFLVREPGRKLADVAAADEDVELAILERDGEARAVVVSDLTYHHVAEGTLGGRPIAIAYCVVCDSAVALTPVVDGRVLHVSAGGLSNGVVLLRDDETGTYWNIFTGEGLAGPLAGRTMATLPVARMRVAEARATRPELELVRADTSAWGRLWTRAVESYARTTEATCPPRSCVRSTTTIRGARETYGARPRRRHRQLRPLLSGARSSPSSARPSSIASAAPRSASTTTRGAQARRAGRRRVRSVRGLGTLVRLRRLVPRLRRLERGEPRLGRARPVRVRRARRPARALRRPLIRSVLRK